MASLYVVRGRDQGKHFVLDGAVLRIGRETQNDLQLLDGEASRRHAEFRADSDGNYLLVDLNSSNGTLVNGHKVHQHELASGDRIEIGGTLLIFTGTGQPTAMDAAHGVDIVRRSNASDVSRIVSSFVRPNSRSGSGSGSSSVVPNIPTDQGRKTEEHLGSASSVSAPTAPESSEHDTSGPLDTAISRDLTRPDSDADEGTATHPVTEADRSLEVMYLTALAVGRTDDLDELLDRILQLVFDWVDADRGCVMLRDNETNQLRPAARCDRQTSDRSSGQSTTEQPISISQTILDYVLDRAEGVRTSNATDDDRFDAAASIVQGGVREALCVPLQGRYDIVGALYVDTFTSPGKMMRDGKTHQFNDEHLRLMTAIGHQAALAIEDTFYYSALLQSERLAAMGQTIATLSHHVKNILQGIRGGSYLIEAGLRREDTDAVRRGWGMVDRNQERISNLVMDMLTFSKEREPQKVDADLNETTGDVVELMMSRASDAAVQLEFSPASEIPVACFDPDALHQAILNLVTNAIDAVAAPRETHDESPLEDLDQLSDAEKPPPARVSVMTGYSKEIGWYVDVVDNGPGVSPEDRQKIFSLFESDKGARGTGLGLPVSAKILREHGGQIAILDAPSGNGCVFRLTLPTQQD